MQQHFLIYWFAKTNNMNHQLLEQEAEFVLSKLKESGGRDLVEVILVDNGRNLDHLGKITGYLKTFNLASPTGANPTLLTVTERGWRFQSFEKEREDKLKEGERADLDDKLKAISIESVKLNKNLGLYALGIAFITAAVPFIVYFISLNDIQQSETRVKQLDSLILLQQESATREIAFRDSILNILNGIKSVSKEYP